jgi:hypothetical protein
LLIVGYLLSYPRKRKNPSYVARTKVCLSIAVSSKHWVDTDMVFRTVFACVRERQQQNESGRPSEGKNAGTDHRFVKPARLAALLYQSSLAHFDVLSDLGRVRPIWYVALLRPGSLGLRSVVDVRLRIVYPATHSSLFTTKSLAAVGMRVDHLQDLASVRLCN